MDIELLRPLPDAHGHPVRVLRLVAPRAEADSAIRSDRRQLQVFGAFGLLVLLAMARALHLWVVQPLDRISASLAAEQPAALGDLAKDKSELGRVAQLVAASFDHREALQREIAERRHAQDALEQSEAALRRNIEDRARLGRDLHDGVIQSLYAAGMGLAGVRAVLTPEQAEAASRLEQTRAALNETIHDVRNFIIGLEPEALKQQAFSRAVAVMLESMRNLREFRSSVDINEELASRLTLAQRVHALQITREAVSNALRHGEANQIQIALRSRGEFAEFEVTDDGRGFDASTAVSSGTGLANFAVRARELGGELEVQSEPGRGTRVKLVFSLLLS
jgi:signal transduction histidine kinase